MNTTTRVYFTACCLVLSAVLSSPGRAADTDYRAMAERAVDDLVRNFWTGNPSTGHIIATWNGLPTTQFPRGSVWEPGTMLTALEDLYQTNHDPILRQRVDAEWKYIRSHFKAKELGTVGDGSYQPALDDAVCSALFYLTVYRVNGDSRCLDFAKGVMDYIWNRWHDDKLGGGCWYRDQRDHKSLWNAAVILVALRLYELTGDRTEWDRATSLYAWAEDKMLCPNGLYVSVMGDGSRDRPKGAVRAGNSASHIGLNMAMGVVHARLYRDTGQRIYRERVVRTMKAVRTVESDGKGHLYNDGDVSTDGFFVGEWVAEVISLPDATPEDEDILRRTAQAITVHARTSDGHYGACWDGPLGPDCKAESEKMLTVTATTVNFVVSAAALDVRRPWPAPRRPPAR